jgi:hypothetical protein
MNCLRRSAQRQRRYRSRNIRSEAAFGRLIHLYPVSRRSIAKTSLTSACWQTGRVRARDREGRFPVCQKIEKQGGDAGFCNACAT